MNPQEHNQLSQFLKQLSEAHVGEKNTEADTLIRAAVAKQPDAAYLLVQRAMLMEQALNNAKAQIAQLQTQIQNPQTNNRGNFLGGGNPWAQPTDNGTSAAAVPGAGNYQIPRAAPAAPAAPAPVSSGAGSFLGSIATTAAGVVAGGFLFQGIENLLGHHASPASPWGGSSTWGDGSASHEPFSDPVAEQTIINNYYDTPPNSNWAQQDEDPIDFLANDDSNFLSDDGDDSNWV
ncbi:MAG: DUF2076 family protein [Methylococcaceae bacterium]|nr:DUF2076 family protein [Methylococcaceae bacterium]